MPTSSELGGGALHELVDLVPGAPRMRSDLGDGQAVCCHEASLGKRSHRAAGGPLYPRYYLDFALAFLDFLPEGSPRSRAYLAMNSSVISLAAESGRWLCGDFIR